MTQDVAVRESIEAVQAEPSTEGAQAPEGARAAEAPRVPGAARTPEPDQPDEAALVDGDAATYLEALGFQALSTEALAEPAEGLPLELVGQHLRLSGTLNLGMHHRLSDYINNHEGVIPLQDVTILRRNGDPTRVTSPNIWMNPDEVTLVAEMTEVAQAGPPSQQWRELKQHELIMVTTGHTLTGTVHLNAEALLSVFIESRSPMWIPMTDVRTRSLADRRVISRYGFAVVNRRHIVAATELQAHMFRGRSVL